MRIIRPIATTDTTLGSSNVAEDDYAEYLPDSDYVEGDRRIVTDAGVHKIFDALRATTGDYPPDSPMDWLEIDSTNRWSMFDGTVGTTTSRSDTIDITITPNTIFNSLALLGVSAEEVVVTVTDPVDGIVYSNTKSLVSTEGVNDWYAYFYEPVIRQTDVIFDDLPTYGSAEIRIQINDTGDTVEVGQLVIGALKTLGMSQYGASFGITDYSIKNIDDFGRTSVVQRDYSKRAEVDFVLENSTLDTVIKTLAQYRSTPLVWIITDIYTVSIIYGYYRDFDITIPYATFSECSIQIEGLI